MLELAAIDEGEIPKPRRGRPPLWTESELDELVLELLDHTTLFSPSPAPSRRTAKSRAEALAQHMLDRGMPCMIRVWHDERDKAAEWRWAVVRKPQEENHDE